MENTLQYIRGTRNATDNSYRVKGEIGTPPDFGKVELPQDSQADPWTGLIDNFPTTHARSGFPNGIYAIDYGEHELGCLQELNIAGSAG